MSAPNAAGQNLAKRARIAAALASEAGMPCYVLVTAEGFYLHESVDGGALTAHRAHAWRGPRERMRRVLEVVPERVRKQVKPLRVATPLPAGRAR